jgi:7-cyano-7-deazaguanine synthase
MKAVVLLSGGMDSTTALAQAMADGSEVTLAISFRYGSKHADKELEAANNVVNYYLRNFPMKSLQQQTHVLSEQMFLGGSSSLMGEGVIPEGEYHDPEKESPSSTVVPYRNAVLLSIATAVATARGFDRVYLGVHSTDAQGFAYPDCTPEFIGAQGSAIYVGTHRQVRLVVPFQWMTKADIVRRAAALEAPLQLTWSCYRGGDIQCGQCPTCTERMKAFLAARYIDPVPYATPRWPVWPTSALEWPVK